ncbi:MAG: hypothetical protein C3F07_04640 [Anaerolineales bacterium]|nr:methyltransferase domain-containing protein [Anaerolineae bacterium]PWB75627.1 MAG: hypothetical protein C3F07_04640 [Anaerolineales bacterium]
MRGFGSGQTLVLFTKQLPAPVRALLRIFFHLLYHQFAFAYDMVAAAVSFGRWNDWILEVVSFIKGTQVLEIGHGPGHLQRVLLSRNLVAIGMDESAPMSRLAKRRLTETTPPISKIKTSPSKPNRSQSGYAQINLARGIAQQLPFRDEAFDTIVATFPSEYFVDPVTMSEAGRCLSNGGRFVVLPIALPKNRFLSWLYQVTGQAPSAALKGIQEKLQEPFVESGFEVETHVLDVQSGMLIIIVAKKK